MKTNTANSGIEKGIEPLVRLGGSALLGYTLSEVGFDHSLEAGFMALPLSMIAPLAANLGYSVYKKNFTSDGEDTMKTTMYAVGGPVAGLLGWLGGSL